jgi:hypothetical protein
MRRVGAGLAGGGLLIGLGWGATAGSRPEAVLGGFDLPIASLFAVIVGFLVWMAGMAKAERAEDAAWAKLATGRSGLPLPRPVTSAARRPLAPLSDDEIRIYRTRPTIREPEPGGVDGPATAEFLAV